MRIGYARVSTPDQSCALQCDALAQSGCTKVFQETASGAHTARPALTATLEYLRAGDTLVVWRLDRLGRSLGQLISLMQVLHSREVGFQSLVEAIDTTTAIGQCFFQITGAFAELERNLIRERTRAGLASARQRGRRGGRPKAIDAETWAMAVQLYQAQTSSVQSICTRLGIARRTFYRYLTAQPHERNTE
jgi:DNA invertase Pin-like site-specific DNA recombinase